MNKTISPASSGFPKNDFNLTEINGKYAIKFHYNKEENTYTTFGEVIGITCGGKFVVNGAFLFQLKATHGLPLSVSIDYVINQKDFVVSWTDYIDEGRKNLLWDFQIYDEIEYSLIDAEIPKKTQREILEQCRRYIMLTLDYAK